MVIFIQILPKNILKDLSKFGVKNINLWDTCGYPELSAYDYNPEEFNDKYALRFSFYDLDEKFDRIGHNKSYDRKRQQNSSNYQIPV